MRRKRGWVLGGVKIDEFDERDNEDEDDQESDSILEEVECYVCFGSQSGCPSSTSGSH